MGQSRCENRRNRRWTASGYLVRAEARIGPNAILQLLPILDRTLGRAARDRLLSGIDLPPPDAGMWSESACRAAHLAVWQGCADQAGAILTEAGQGTADYILVHRIPAPAKALIRALPAPLGARLLTAAITRHAWTFIGSGRFCVAARSPLSFEITDNPLAFPGLPCPWHVAVFTRLYQRLVWPAVRIEAADVGRISRFILIPRQGTLIAPLRALLAWCSDDARQGGKAARKLPDRDKTVLD